MGWAFFDFLRMMKDLNISVKLDTNGSIPDILGKVLKMNWQITLQWMLESPSK